jgi:HEAT repeat protein
MLRVLSAVAKSPRLQVALLSAFFFLNELGAYFTGVLACTLLVKRAGAGCLPAVYLLLNLVFLPIALAVILFPPRSSTGMVRRSMAAYLGLLLVVMPLAGSDSGILLGLVYVVARMGKLLTSSFDAGMVAEVLPLRDAKAATPRLLASTTGGLVAGGLLLNPALALFGTWGTFLALWCCIAAAFVVVALLAASMPGGAGAPGPESGSTEAAGEPDLESGSTGAAAVVGTVRAALGELLALPLPRLMGGIGFFTVGLRYLLEYAFAAAQERHFASEREMAAFAGNFEAALSITIVLVQLLLVGPLIRKLKLGGIVLALPSAMVAWLAVAATTTRFEAIAAGQFLYWLCFDCFSQSSRQVMIGAVPAALVARVPVVMTVTSIAGSLVASLLLVPLSRMGGTGPALLVAWFAAAAFLVWVRPAGRIYSATLTGTLEALDARGRVEVLSALGAAEEGERGAGLAVLLAAPDPEIRERAVREASALGPDLGVGLILERLPAEGDPRVRAAILAAAAPFRPPGFGAVLRRYASDPDARVRANALEGLSFFGDDPDVRPLVRAGLESPMSRERAAAIMAVVRGSADRGELGGALDHLAAMARDASRPDARSAAAAAMGRLGYPFFLPDLARLLADPDRSARSTALDALSDLHAPGAHEVLVRAGESETDPDLRERIARAVGRFADETISSIVGVLDSLSGEDRTRIRHALGSLAPASGHRSEGGRDTTDARVRLIRGALDVDHPRLRSELVRLAQVVSDPVLLETLERCIVPVPDAAGGPGGAAGRESLRPGRVTVDLCALLEHLVLRLPAQARQGYQALAHLVDEPTEDGLVRHVTHACRRLWTYTAIGEALMQRAPDERARSIAARALEEQRRLIEHVFSVTGMTAPAPERAVRMMRAALGSDRYRSSLCLELLEDWLPRRVREPLFPVLESFPDAALRRARAFEQAGLAPDGASVETLLAAAAREGLA